MSVEMLAEEEQLYQEYLAARVTQAEQEAQATKKVAQETGQSEAYQGQIEDAELKTKLRQAELSEQAARAAEALRIAAAAKAERMQKAMVMAKIKAKEAQEKLDAINKQKAKLERAKLKAKIAAEAAKKARQKAISALKAAEAAKKSKSKSKASRAFKTAQAAKARQAISNNLNCRVELKPIVYNNVSSNYQEQKQPEQKNQKTGVSAFRATQAKRAALLANFKECPNCTAQLKKNAESCKCGYIFQDGATDMPALSMDFNDIQDVQSTITNVNISSRPIKK